MDPPSYEDSLQAAPAADQSNSSIEQSDTKQSTQLTTDLQLPTTTTKNAVNLAHPTKSELSAIEAAPNELTLSQQQQEPTIVYISASYQRQVVVQQQFIESYVGHQALACFVMWFCNFIFGLIAWILALCAESKKFKNREEARQLGRASRIVSTCGISISVIAIAIIIGISAS